MILNKKFIMNDMHTNFNKLKIQDSQFMLETRYLNISTG